MKHSHFIAGGLALLAFLTWRDARAAISDAVDMVKDSQIKITPELLAIKNVAAFLMVIRNGEGTADADGFRRIFGGRLFSGFADHPRIFVTARLGGKPITSSAAGAYQFLARTWDECKAALNLPDFSPMSQHLAALFLIRRRGALGDVIEGRFKDAVRKCAPEWASLPGSPYGQPTKTIEQASMIYASNGGTYA